MAIKGKRLGVGTNLTLTLQQHVDAGEFGTVKKTGGGWQSTFAKIHAETKSVNGKLVVTVYPKVLQDLKAWANIAVDGSYQEWCREVLAANNITWP